MKIQEIKNDLIELGLRDNLNLALLIYLAASARNTKDKISVLVSGPAGLGKSTVANTVLKLFPQGDIMTVSRMTPAALVKQGDLRGKILYVYEKFKDRQFAQYVRELLSEGQVIYETANGRLELQGPTTLIETTVNSGLLETENKSRCFVASINKELEARQNILDRQKRLRTGEGITMQKREEGIQEKHRVFQATLAAPLFVDIPFATRIRFQARSYHAPRILKRILDVISSIAFLKQHDRNSNAVEGKPLIIATEEDFYEAKEILCCLSIDEEEFVLSKDTIEFVATLKKYREEISDPITHSKILDVLGNHGSNMSYRRLRKQLRILTEIGFMECRSERGKKGSFVYIFTKDFALSQISETQNSCYSTLSLT